MDHRDGLEEDGLREVAVAECHRDGLLPDGDREEEVHIRCPTAWGTR